MAASIARRIAYEVLLRAETRGAYADELLHARLEPAAGTKRSGAPVKREDAALATELVMGVLRWQRRLDSLLGNYLDKKNAKRGSGRAGESATARLDAEVRVALRLGAYQLGWLERVPARAAVHESVELVKVAGKGSAAGLVNAVLRRVAEARHKQKGGHTGPPLQISSRLPLAERLGIAHSHPTWLVERWLRAWGEEETVALLQSNNSAPRGTCAVANEEEAEAVAEELRSEGFKVRAGWWLRGALDVSGGSLARTRAFREGRVRRQDEASQMVAWLVDVRPGMRVLDLCAAPGGKTVTLARAAGPNGLVIAADVHLHRLADMRERAGGFGSGRPRGSPPQSDARTELAALDGTTSLPFSREFERILVDAPCSGTGTLARNPEIRWRLRPEDLAELQVRQRALLESAAEGLAAGGKLVYSTCSLEPEENEQVVEAVLKEHAELKVVSGWEALEKHLRFGVASEHEGRLPSTGALQISDLKLQSPTLSKSERVGHLTARVSAGVLFDTRGYFRTRPQRHSTDGFFAAVLVRPD